MHQCAAALLQRPITCHFFQCILIIPKKVRWHFEDFPQSWKSPLNCVVSAYLCLQAHVDVSCHVLGSVLWSARGVRCLLMGERVRERNLLLPRPFRVLSEKMLGFDWQLTLAHLTLCDPLTWSSVTDILNPPLHRIKHRMKKYSHQCLYQLDGFKKKIQVSKSCKI